MLGLYGGIKFISGLYVGDRAGKYFIFVSNLKLIKTITKNSKCYASTFSII